jgi:hypothetical protein
MLPVFCFLCSLCLKAASGSLQALLYSLLAGRAPNMHVELLLTDPYEYSSDFLHNIAAQVNAHYGNNPYSGAPFVHVSPVNSTSARQAWNAVDDSWGFLSTDEVIHLLMMTGDLSGDGAAMGASIAMHYPENLRGLALYNRTLEMPPYPRAGTRGTTSACKYFLLTNGDNLYNVQLMQRLTYYMRRRAPLIGFDFTSRHPLAPVASTHQPFCTVAGLGRNQQVYSQFVPEHIDLGAMAISAELFQGRRLRFCAEDIQQGKPCDATMDGFMAKLLFNLVNDKQEEAAAWREDRVSREAVVIHECLMFHM